MSSNKKYDLAVVIGRFQIYHNAHQFIGQEALNIADRVIFVIGSVNKPRDIVNPFSFDERCQMIRASLSLEDAARVQFVAARENSNDQVWASRVQGIVSDIARLKNLPNPKIALVGVKKDKSSFYLDMFPQWEFVGVDTVTSNEYVIHAADIRKIYFEAKSMDAFSRDYASPVPPQTRSFLINFATNRPIEYANLREEWAYVEQLKARWADAPYEPTFTTTDAVIVQAGHILLVRRGARPGKGLWALPGGYLGAGERLIDSMLRELREETKLKVPTPVLKGSIKSYKEFDDPERDVRGRFITHAYFIELANGPLPPVKGSDDADKARWVPLSEFWKMEEVMFADHYEIVQYFLGGA
jgi:bifunctional NMN adenylyltransferase/nudix hydrolase